MNEIANCLKSWFPNQIISGLRTLASRSLEEVLPHLPRVLELGAHRFGSVRTESERTIAALVERDFDLFVSYAADPVHSRTALLCCGVALKQCAADLAAQIRSGLSTKLAEFAESHTKTYLIESPPGNIRNVIDAMLLAPNQALLLLKSRLAEAPKREATALLSLAWRLGDCAAEILLTAGVSHRSREVATRAATTLHCWDALTLECVMALICSKRTTSRIVGYSLLGDSKFRSTVAGNIAIIARDLAGPGRNIRQAASELVIRVWGRVAGFDEWCIATPPRWLDPLSLDPRWHRRANVALGQSSGPKQSHLLARFASERKQLSEALRPEATELAELLLRWLTDSGSVEAEKRTTHYLAVLWVASQLLPHLAGELRERWSALLMFHALSAETDAERSLGSGGQSLCCLNSEARIA